MTDVTSGVEAGKAATDASEAVDEALLSELMERARAGGVSLTGEGGLLQQLTKRVLESALEGGGRPVKIKVPRDRAGSLDPQLFKKGQKRLTDELLDGAVAVREGAHPW